MRKLVAVLLAGLVAVVVTATPATAASPHFKKNGSPTCTVSQSGSTSSTTCTATLAGLGGGDVHIELTVAGSATYQCQNNGGQLAPGQNRVLVGPTTTPTDIDGDAVKNGNLTFTTNPAVLSAPTTVSAADAGCPSANWTGVNPTLTVTSITLDIFQGGLLFHCTASSSNGLSGTVALSC